MDELSLIPNVVIRPRVERYLGFAGSKKNRRKFLDSLYHFADFDPAVIVSLQAPEDTPEGILHQLVRRGAEETCFVASTDGRIDRATLPLKEALLRIHGLIEGTLVVCSSRLGYYEGEPPHNNYILHRRA